MFVALVVALASFVVALMEYLSLRRCPIHGVRMARDDEGELRCPEVPCVFGAIEERR
jgi:hypothetical protein